MGRNSIKVHTEKCNLQLFSPQNTTPEAKEIVRSIFNHVLNDSVTDSTDIAVDFVNEIVNSPFESAQKPTAHSGSSVNKSTF